MNTFRNLVFVGFFAILFYTCEEKTANLEADSVRRAIKTAGEYLSQQVKPDGAFVYQRNLNPQVKHKDK